MPSVYTGVTLRNAEKLLCLHTALTVGGLDRQLHGFSLMAGILIVDDNSSIRCLLRGFVETQTPFIVCGEAGNGVEAIQRAKELEPDLILLDLSMPVLGGAEAAPVIKKMMPGAKIVLFSMHVDNVLRSLAATIGVDLALSKSDGVVKLGEHLKALLTPDVPKSALTLPVEHSFSQNGHVLS